MDIYYLLDLTLDLIFIIRKKSMSQYCKCHSTMTLKQAVDALKDEVAEFIQEPSKDELSDIVYCANRLAGSLLNKPYKKVIPFDSKHIRKINIRMKIYGCIRSKNHLVDGKCPSEASN